MWWFECSRCSFLKCFLRSAICLCDAYIFQEFPLSCRLKMCATAGACIGLFSSAAVSPQSKSTKLRSSAAVVLQSKSTELCSSAAVVPHKGNLPSCVVGRRPLCHTHLNLPRCDARRRDFIMTCDIFGTGQTNILALFYLFQKKLIHQPKVAPHSCPWNQRYTRPNY